MARAAIASPPYAASVKGSKASPTPSSPGCGEGMFHKNGRYSANKKPQPAMMWRISSRPRRSHHHHHGVFDQLLECPDQLCPERAVDGAVIAGQRHAHHLRDLDLATAYHRALLAGADGQDRRLRRVDHGGEVVDAVHAEVRHRRGAALIFFRLQLPRP